MRIDSHQHFWKYDPFIYDWIGEGMERIQGDALPSELKKLLITHHFDGCVAVQSEQSEAHTHFLLDLSNENDFIKGVVGWVDLRDVNLRNKLDVFLQFPKLKGFRHILQGEPKRDMMLEPSFMQGLHLVGERGFTYDILVYADQLSYVTKMVEQCPGQKLILDHLGKPLIRKREIGKWRKEIKELGKFENLSCKLSGIVTEADWKNWTKDDLTPYLEVVINAFGVDRLLFGSDWPVCLVAAEYEQVVEIIENYFSSFSSSEKEKIFGINAVEFYNLKPS
jgi:L-fuconolactonase